MSGELKPENRALVERVLGHVPFPDRPSGVRQGFTSDALNRLLDAAREEARPSPGGGEEGHGSSQGRADNQCSDALTGATGEVALREAQEVVCEALCPSVKRTGDPWTHVALCQTLSRMCGDT